MHSHDDGTTHDHAPWENDDGTLHIASWASYTEMGEVLVGGGPGPVQMAATTATAWPLVTSHRLGVDRISVPAGGGFAPHTHPGDHLLIIIRGKGTITMGGRIYPTRAGQVYFVPGLVPHAVGAITEHHILAVGAPHRMPDDADRMELTAYAAIASDLGVLRCEICDVEGPVDRLADMGCTHAPARST